ncbi:Kelch repeat-containing protein [Hyphobacterium marinum]|uniref:Kelch repeat-containing protein n=1 Tax=Hyphobacterium marinum TaxID=3116574 RepID=A0ABU7M0A4_9PROT|nr:kelch repeat-containing protein [Hyphobacterium sp. Y6023]MEE2567244.1 kelch repeat-containing protein [Hyphobacterium sp. Y6023]
MRKFLTALALVCLWPALASAQGEWRDGPALLSPRSGLAAAELEGKIYAAGGAGLTQPRNEVEVFDPDLGEWRDVTALPSGLERFGMTAANGRLYAAGGYAAREGVRPIADMWSYAPETGVWQRETAMPGPMASFQLVGHDGHLYALGGETGTSGMFVFDIEAREWTARDDTPDDVSRRGGAAVVVDGRILFIGGAHSGIATERVDVYDIASGTWSQAADMPTPRAGHAAVLSGGRIHVFGGRGEDLSRTLSDHISYDPVTDSWRAESELRSPRTDAAAATLNGMVYLVGGGAGGGFFAPFTAIDVTDIFVPDGH